MWFVCPVAWCLVKFGKSLHAISTCSRTTFLSSDRLASKLVLSYMSENTSCFIPVSVASIHKLKVAYNNVFWMLLRLLKYCSASTMFVENCVPNSEAVIRNLVYKFMLRLDASDNKLVNAIMTSDLLFVLVV